MTLGATLSITLTLLYILPLLMIISIIPWNTVNSTESPFITALSAFNLPYIDSVLNIIIISAAFSTMVGALFSITNILISLSKDGDAPQIVSRTNQRGVAVYALGFSGIGLAAAIILSFLLPNTVFEYLVTAAGVLLIVNWMIILASQIKNRPGYALSPKRGFKMAGYPYTSLLGIGLILFVITGSLLIPSERIGFFISLGLISLILTAYFILKHRWK